MNKNENVIWQANKVSYEDRCKVLGQQGKVIWFTGLSGSGKSTIAVELEKMLNEAGKAVYLLDGDNIRCGINSDLGFSDEDRNENIRRIGEIAALFRDAGIITLVSFISPFREMRRVARERAGEGNFVEVYVNTNLQTCMERDPKGLYKKDIKNFTGKDSSYEEPVCPELIADTEKYTAVECAKQIFDYIMV
ncbi:MAG: adenylyl-sulfate kinase [Eubacterium sp.]